MAKAFATFPNEGRRVEPLAIRYIEDRNGNIVVNPEQDLREAQQRNARDQQILSEQTAYIMTDILESVVDWGTLRWPRSLVDGFDVPMAGKTGTTQNWADAWTVGFSPYLTTAVWIGFDEGGNSLGTNQTGAVTAGPIWARYMDDVHSGLRDRDFQRPPSGIVEVEVTAETGLLPPQGYEGQVITELFRRGTEPTRFDDSREYRADQQTEIVDRMQASLGSSDALRSMNLDLSEPLTLSDPLRDRGPSGGGNLFLDEPAPEEEAEESGNIYLD
jgi:penicillin-binding protein 1A